MKKALILVNVGTPKQATVPEVRKFLGKFLNDKRVIDIPWLFRKILVNLIIIPFRTKKSTILYQKLFTPEGSPLLIYLISLANKLQEQLKERYTVYPALSYGEPSLDVALEKIRKEQFDEIVVLPLYPQFASSTTGSVSEKIFKVVKNWQVVPHVRFINQFYNHPAFIRAFITRISEYQPSKFDHIVFSYHGLPMRQINKIHPERNCHDCLCEKALPEGGNWCYKATCYETSRLLANELNIPLSMYSVGFQSRLSKKWLSPFSDELIVELAKNDKSNILVVAPSFVADCLETIVEIESDYRQLFIRNSGKELVMVKSLNDSDVWVEAIGEIITGSILSQQPQILELHKD